MPAKRSAVLLGVTLLGCALAQPKKRPSLSGSAAKSANSEESLGSTLLSAVVGNDLAAAAAIFEGVSGSQAVRLANAIDWRGKSVLMHAASRDHAEMTSLLIAQKARIDAADYTGGATALMLAARNGSATTVDALITAGAKVNVVTPQGTTVLMQAVANGSLPIAASLLAAGAEANAKDKSGASALSIAASLGLTDMARLLVAGGADATGADAVAPHISPISLIASHCF